MARQISVQRAAMITFFRPVLLTASTPRLSSQVLMKVRLIGFCSGKTSCSSLIRKPPRSSTTVVRIVGTPNSLACLGETDDVVHDHGWFVTVQVSELECLMV